MGCKKFLAWSRSPTHPKFWCLVIWSDFGNGVSLSAPHEKEVNLSAPLDLFLYFIFVVCFKLSLLKIIRNQHYIKKDKNVLLSWLTFSVLFIIIFHSITCIPLCNFFPFTTNITKIYFHQFLPLSPDFLLLTN